MSKTIRPFVPLNVAVLTLSDTRTRDTDSSGDLIEEKLKSAGHQVAARTIVREDLDKLRAQFKSWIDDTGVDVIIATGGTGMTQRDLTPEAVKPFIAKSIPGFGELFRMLSYAEIGTSTIQSRADAGITANGTVIFMLPGSTNAKETASTSNACVVCSRMVCRTSPTCKLALIEPALSARALITLARRWLSP